MRPRGWGRPITGFAPGGGLCFVPAGGGLQAGLDGGPAAPERPPERGVRGDGRLPPARHIDTSESIMTNGSTDAARRRPPGWGGRRRTTARRLLLDRRAEHRDENESDRGDDRPCPEVERVVPVGHGSGRVRAAMAAGDK